MKTTKTTADFTRKELCAMIAMLRGQLYSIVHVEEELDQDRLEELQLTLDATQMDLAIEDEENGGFAKKWFNEFLNNYEG